MLENKISQNSSNITKNSKNHLSKKTQWFKAWIKKNIEWILDPYKWMEKIVITLRSGEEKEVYVLKHFLTLKNDDVLKYVFSDGTKSNFPKNKIKNNPFLITKNTKWDYHFWFAAAMEEVKNQWMRLPTEDEIKSKDFEEYIQKSTVFFPGFRDENGDNLHWEWIYAYFWGDKNSYWNVRAKLWLSFCRVPGEIYKNNGYSIRPVKDCI